MAKAILPRDSSENRFRHTVCTADGRSAGRLPSLQASVCVVTGVGAGHGEGTGGVAGGDQEIGGAVLFRQ